MNQIYYTSCFFRVDNEKFYFYHSLFLIAKSSSDLELECFGESDLCCMRKEILGETWRLGLESKPLGFYFSINESEKSGSVRFIGLMNKETSPTNKSFSLSSLEISKRLISAKVKIDIDRKGSFEIDRVRE